MSVNIIFSPKIAVLIEKHYAVQVISRSCLGSGIQIIEVSKLSLDSLQLGATVGI